MTLFKSTIGRSLITLIIFFLQKSIKVDSLVTENYIRDAYKQFVTEPEDTIILKPEYDFIIVGAGSAGCTLGNRLSEIPSWEVLLVEAGGHELFFMDVPLFADIVKQLPVNWGYKSEPGTTYCTGFVDNECNLPRGKVVGGSSVLNTIIYTRGTSYDYDNWKAMGNEGWGWDDVVPYFKKFENYKVHEFQDPQFHSQGGPLNVEYTPYRTNKSKAWVEAAKEYGFHYGDYNGPVPSGMTSFLQFFMINGTRHSASRAYLHSIRDRSNFHLSKHSLVTKLIYNSAKTAVVGVELIKFGIKYHIYARKEVILSAGAINSPQLLLLSGIGPKEDLTQLGIPVIKDLPVGYNLMDHIATGGLTFTVEEKINTISFYYFLTNYKGTVIKYMDEHRGPLAVPGGIEALVYTGIGDKFNTSTWPDVELLLAGTSLNEVPTAQHDFNFRNDYFKQVYGPLKDKNAFMVVPMLLRPKSKGRVKLRDGSPHSAPVIITNYLDYEEDLDLIIKGVKLAIELIEMPALKAIGAKLYDEPLKPCLEKGVFGSDEYFKCMTRMFTFTIYHQSGTCKMGPAADPTSVVDSDLRVHGISNIRVVDASIMPFIPACHISGPVHMIAENAADRIKKHWKKI